MKLHDLIVNGLIGPKDPVVITDGTGAHKGAWVEDHMLKYWNAEIAGYKRDEDGTWKIRIKEG
jgi:hypothetical protein